MVALLNTYNTFRVLTILKSFNRHDSTSYFLKIPKLGIVRINQDGGVEGRALTPSCESTRITTGCWKIFDRKTLDFNKEDTPRPRTEEKPQ